jgi:nitrite reductase/ring-hydroxylating ferredoxin subunit
MSTVHRIGDSDSVAEGGRLVVDVAHVTVGVFRVEGRLYAYENTCPHMGGPVCQGLMIPAVVEKLNDANVSTGFAFNEDDPRIVCPWHGFEFSIKTGCHPASQTVRLRAIPVHEADGAIHVTV